MDYQEAEEEIRRLIAENSSSGVLQDVVDFLYTAFDKYSWVGIYVVRGNDLVLGPWRGPQATEHTRIAIGAGVCGSAAQTGKIEIVPDVSEDDRYLACFRSTRSEIVVPIKRNKTVVGEIDIDSDVSDAFNQDDAMFLESIAALIARFIVERYEGIL